MGRQIDRMTHKPIARETGKVIYNQIEKQTEKERQKNRQLDRETG